MNDAVYKLHRGIAPLLVSIPHDGRDLLAGMRARLSPAGLAMPDTDWHVGRLYAFAKDLGASIIAARYSRYVIDLNRPASDDALYPGQLSTGLCPSRTFRGEAIYADGSDVSVDERELRVAACWHPYHDAIQAELDRLLQQHGHAVLWDAHSIVSVVPALFDGELPVLNLGTYGGRSCSPAIEQAVWREAASLGYSAVRNGRFKGGFITRHYGDPANGVHALQLELAQQSYMDESTLRYDAGRAGELAGGLCRMLETCLEASARLAESN